jgi:hypothetical protein
VSSPNRASCQPLGPDFMGRVPLALMWEIDFPEPQRLP